MPPQGWLSKVERLPWGQLVLSLVKADPPQTPQRPRGKKDLGKAGTKSLCGFQSPRNVIRECRRHIRGLEVRMELAPLQNSFLSFGFTSYWSLVPWTSACACQPTFLRRPLSCPSSCVMLFAVTEWQHKVVSTMDSASCSWSRLRKDAGSESFKALLLSWAISNTISWTSVFNSIVITFRQLRFKVRARDPRRVQKLWSSACDCGRGCFQQLAGRQDEFKSFLELFWGLRKLQQDVYAMTSDA